MKKEEIYNAFVRLFPKWEESVISYKKIGSRAICLFFEEKNKKLIFFYNNDEDWTFGTKVWRNRPVNSQRDVTILPIHPYPKDMPRLENVTAFDRESLNPISDAFQELLHPFNVINQVTDVIKKTNKED